MNNTETTENTEPVATVEPEKVAFGEALLQARTAKAYSISEVAKATHLAEHIIDAIEQSDLKRLPPPTFVQGYLRTYARYLGLSEQKIVDAFSRAVPYKRETVLQPRVPAVTQASSHSPLIFGVSLSLVFLLLLTVVYGAYKYYLKTAEAIGQEQINALALKSLEMEGVDPDQHAVISQDGELIVIAPESEPEPVAAPAIVAIAAVPENTLADTQSGLEQRAASTASVSAAVPVMPKAVVADTSTVALDVIEVHAYDNSWVEIVDATNKELFRNLVQNEQVLRLKGEAPFEVFLGNAPGIELKVNKLDVKILKYIRANHVARFSVSTRDGSVVFH